MKVSLKKAFSLIDGRLSTEISDVYEMLNYIFDADLYTHQLPTAFDRLKEARPKWFSDSVKRLNKIKSIYGNDFHTLMSLPELNEEVELGKISFTEGLK